MSFKDEEAKGEAKRPSPRWNRRPQGLGNPELDLAALGAQLETVDSDGEDGSHLGMSGRTGGSGMLAAMGNSHSVLDMTGASMAAVRDKVKTQRPPEEVVCSVLEMLGLPGAPPSTLRRVSALVNRILEQSDQEAAPELVVFSSHLESLLGTIFAQIAEYLDTFQPGERNEEECMVLSGLLHPSVMEDIVAASRLSLGSYHEHTMVLRSKGKSPRRQQGHKNISPRAGACWSRRQLSSLAHPVGGPQLSSQGSTVADFMAAFSEGKVGDSGRKPHKRRPDTRIDRDGSESPVDGSLPFPPSLSRTHRETPPNKHLSPSFASASPRLNHDDNNSTGGRSGGRGASPGPGGGFCTQRDLERVLKGLSTLQYFDIIVETLCVVLCIKYEEQLIELTHEGDMAGAKRAAEWATARIIDEFFNDGIDPQLPLCKQLILCLEGLALEEGEIVCRRAAGVDPDVAMVVWGVELPDDVAGMTLQRRNTKVTWYEWGAFAQPGVRCADSSHWTGPRLNPHTYGWRLGSKELVEAIGLRAHDGGRSHRLPSFMIDRPGENLVDPTSVCGITVQIPQRVDSMSSGGAASTAQVAAPATGLPALSLSAPPEGSKHAGGAKRKPHIRPQDPVARRELERLYQANAVAKAAQAAMDGGDLDDYYEEEEEEEEEEQEQPGGLQASMEMEDEPPRQKTEDVDSMEREQTTPVDQVRQGSVRDGVQRSSSSRVRRQKPTGNGNPGNKSFPPPGAGAPSAPPPLHKPRSERNDSGEHDPSGNYEPLKDKSAPSGKTPTEPATTSPSLLSTNASGSQGTGGSKCCCIIT
eukprot:Hpha_TRINITY_DN16033_c0_g2::TRINITY_DN16033_c0_g2_i1::g.121669::m.121669